MANNPVPPPPPLTVEVIQQLLANQAQDIAIRAKELEVQQKGLDNSHDWALKALEAQAKDREGGRLDKKSARRDKMFFGGIMVTVLIGLVGYALYIGKDALAMKIAEAAIYLAVGSLGGYSVGVRKGSEKQDTD